MLTSTLFHPNVERAKFVYEGERGIYIYPSTTTQLAQESKEPQQ